MDLPGDPPPPDSGMDAPSVGYIGSVSAANTLWFGSFGGSLSSWYSTAQGANVDGAVVVGAASTMIIHSHAFRWTLSDNTMHDLGTFGGSDSSANGVNADGSVVVGWASTGNNNPHAFRWTLSDNTMHDLGTLGGSSSEANGVNADGSVVVGSAVLRNNSVHAFRWTLSDNTMHDLGTLGGSLSEANGVNVDGSVVVGWASTTNYNHHAFRWTLSDNTMHDLGTLGGSYSVANGINADGSVVVGGASTVNNDLHAFRWTLSDNTMHDLGTLGGKHANAWGVNTDGTVVVGWSTKIDEFSYQAFRWTQATGMQSVEAWIVANGGSPLASGNRLEAAYSVSADGNVVVGYGYLNGNGQGFIAIVPGGILGMTDFQESLRSPTVPGGILGMTDFQESLRSPTVAGAVLHDRMWTAVTTNLQNNAPSHGQFALSSQGIYDKYTKDGADGDGSSGVFKLIYGVSDWWRIGGSYIRAGERLDLDDNGTMKNDIDIFGGLLSYGDYKGDGLRGRLSFAYGNGDADLGRTYLTAAGSDQSLGHLGAEQFAYAAEIGYGFRLAPQTLITPLASYEWMRSSLDGYNETGGAFPAHFDGRTLEDSYARGGVKVKQGLSSVLDLNLDANYVVRLSSTRNPVSGSLVGLGTYGVFNQNVELSKDWVELRTGVDYVPESISKNLHLTLGGQVNIGQEFDVPAYRIDAGFVLFF